MEYDSQPFSGIDDVLYIIGNGFDLFHGVRSSYADFKQYTKVKNPQLFQQLNVYFEGTDLWSDFENSLGYLSRKAVLYDASIMLPDFDSDLTGLQMAEILMAGDFIAGVLNELLTDIKKTLHQWVLSLKLSYTKIQTRLNLDYYARFINFNYTTFLESLYGIERDRINYIHGNKLHPIGSLIVGHGSTNDEAFETWYKQNRIKTRNKVVYDAYFNRKFHHPSLELVVESIEEYFENSAKATSQIIDANRTYFSRLSGIKYIYVLGHSVSKVDVAYFHEIIRNNQNSKAIMWLMAYHRPAQRDILYKKLSGIGISPRQITMITWDFLCQKV